MSDARCKRCNGQVFEEDGDVVCLNCGARQVEGLSTRAGANGHQEVAERPFCCFVADDFKLILDTSVGCTKPPTWRAHWDGPPADSFTDGCDDHIGKLLDPDCRNIRLSPLPVGAPA